MDTFLAAPCSPACYLLLFCPYGCSSSCPTTIPGCSYSRIILVFQAVLFQAVLPSALSFLLFYCWFNKRVNS